MPPAEATGDEREALAATGARATPDAPLAAISLEGSDGTLPVFEVRLRSWPAGTEELIALARAHGPPVRWLGE